MKKTNLIFYLSLNMIVFFFVPYLILSPNVGVYFWASVAIINVGLVLSILQRGHALPYYFLFLLFVVCFGYYIQSSIGVRFLANASHPPQLTAESFLVFSVHVVGVLVGAYAFHHVKVKRVQRAYTEQQSISRGNILFCGLISVIVIVVIILLNDTAVFFVSRSVRYLDREISSGSLFATNVAKSILFFVAAFWLQGLLQKRRPARAWVAFSILIVAAVLFSNPANTPRFISLSTLSFAFAFAISSMARTRKLMPLLFLFPLISSLLLPITSQLRFGLPSINVGSIVRAYSSLEFSSMQMLNDALQLSDELSNSNYTISGVFIVIPRAIWPSKANSLGVEIAESSGYIYSNSAVPSLISSYVDMGYLGLLLFSIFLGAILSWSRLHNNMDWRRRKDIYRIIVFALVPILARGDWSTCMISFYALASAYEVCRFASKFTLKVGPIHKTSVRT